MFTPRAASRAAALELPIDPIYLAAACFFLATDPLNVPAQRRMLAIAAR
jgi:hypothetical protein